MKIAIPIENDLGLDSRVYGHFGSAPCFLVYDTETKAVTFLDNSHQQHAHGQCNPLSTLAGQTVNAVVTGGIGGRALQLLNANRIRVYRAPQAGTAGEVVGCLEKEGLEEITSSACCSDGGHAHGGQGHGCHS